MEIKVSVKSVVQYELVGFNNISGNYKTEEFESVRDKLREHKVSISHEVIEGVASDNDGFVIVVVITIINLDE